MNAGELAKVLNEQPENDIVLSVSWETKGGGTCFRHFEISGVVEKHPKTKINPGTFELGLNEVGI